jgi:hypothetical protein
VATVIGTDVTHCVENIFEGASSYRDVVLYIIIRKVLSDFQHTMVVKIVISDMSLKTQDFSSLGLSTQEMTPSKTTYSQNM